MSMSPPLLSSGEGSAKVTHHLEASHVSTAEESQSGHQATEPVSACTNCRRRKLKCSKELPKCRQCQKTAIECEYDHRRGKTGMKVGAIETLHKRIDALEARVQSQERDNASPNTRSPRHSSAGPTGSNAYGILSFFAEELRKFNSQEPQPHDGRRHSQPQPPPQPSAKRRRLNDGDDDSSFWSRTPISTPGHLDDRSLGPLLKAYFSHIHPWIPMLHERRLRSRMSDTLSADQQRSLEVVLTAIRLTASRFIDDPELASTCVEETYEKYSQARDWVILQAMKRPSVESLQALIILAFQDIGSGEASVAWSIIGSLTRTAEYLQLTIEHDELDRQSRSLVQPYTSLQPPQDWTEEEERRRVFWTIFNLDRYCSVTMGWNTSLTSHDVNRRLPCDGLTWRKETPAETPFFGIWDKATSRIGNPIAYLPSHFSRPTAHAPSAAAPHATASPGAQHPNQHVEQHTSPDQGSTPGTTSFFSSTIDMSAVGAFAYSIEATESLSRVNTYFLQQPNIHDERDLPSWITRFKELDLRLVHWKMFLPRKWKADHVTSGLGSRMDPNLTLAHVTHNASMILLHQVIAFPLDEWDFFKHRLPSVLSVDTCQAAAVEIATIAKNFLKITEKGNETMPIAPQFAFCVYIAGRFLLLLWQAGGAGSEAGQILPQFWACLSILNNMATRWSGPHGYDFDRKANLAAKYLERLRALHTSCVNDTRFHIDPLGYTTEIDPSPTETVPPGGQGWTPGRTSTEYQRTERLVTQDRSNEQTVSHHQSQHQEPQQPPPPPRMPVDPRVMGVASQFQTRSFPLQSPQEQERINGRTNGPSEERGFISQMLMDQQFMDLDRVISFDDGLFGSEFEPETW